MNLDGRTVLVTGGTGFLGGRLVEALVEGYGAKVRVLARSFSRAVRIGRFPITLIHGDMTDRDVVDRAVSGCDVVFHCAYDSGVDMGAQARTAIEGMRAISEAVLAHGVPRLVHVSSFVVYGPMPDGDLSETCAWGPTRHGYIKAKRATERLVFDLHREQRLPVVVVQPSLVYGPFCRPWTLKPVEDLKTGLVPLVNGGEGYCNAVYVDDVVEAMLLAATRPGVLGETFLISGEAPVTWRSFYGAFEQALGLQATLDVSEERLRALWRERQAAKDGRFLSELLRVVRKTAVARGAARFLLKALPTEYYGAVRRAARRGDGKRDAPGGSPAPRKKASGEAEQIARLHVPNDTLLDWYRSKTVVRIDKAAAMLGYRPKFDLGRGMQLTADYIRWANLA
jgi:nucleoside-diphosphate-sugar epimerase